MPKDVPVLAIGPANYAGQAHDWAKAVKQNLDAQAWSFTRGPVRRGGFRFPADKTIPAPLFHLPVGRRLRSRWLFRHTTHIALDGFQAYFRLIRRGKFAPDTRWLAKQGRRVALIAHGTDVRDPEAHLERNGRWSHFSEADEQYRTALIASSKENREFAQDAGLPVFYSTPDLGLDLPTGTWLPTGVDVDYWWTSEPVLDRPVPRVLHLPSKRNPPIKGTGYIDPVLREMAAYGLVEYVSPSAVAHHEMRTLVRSADIVIDQLLIGTYGVAAIEAMAAGRVVIGRLAPQVHAKMPECPPIMNADPDTLRTVLDQILDQRAEMRERAAAGQHFVRRWHDGRASANALAGYLGVEPAEIT